MNGRILGIKIGDTFVPCEMSCDISIDGERIATSSRENGSWRNSIAGYRSWKASVNGKFQLDASEGSEAGSLGLIQAIIDGVNVELVMTLRIDSTQSLLIGGIAGTTNVTISGASTGDATWTGNFDGVGLLDLDYNLEGGFLRNGDGERIVTPEGRGIVVNSGEDFYYPQDASKVAPTGTKILVADVNDEIAWVDPKDISENSFTTALKNAYDNAVTWIATNGGALLAHLLRTDNPHSVTKSQVGLGNVNNTSDLDKPISAATQEELENYATKIELTQAIGYTDVVDYPLDFTPFFASSDPGGYDYINDVAVVGSGTLKTLRIRATLGSTITVYVFEVINTAGVYTYIKKHTYPTFVTTQAIHSEDITDNFFIQEGYFIGIKSTGGTFFQYDGFSSPKGWITIYNTKTDFCFSYDFEIEELAIPEGGIYPIIDERLKDLEDAGFATQEDINLAIGYDGDKAYNLDLSLFSGNSEPTFTYINNLPLINPGILKKLTVKTTIGTTITPYVYKITGPTSESVFELIHTYDSFTTTSVLETQDIADDFLIDEGMFIAIKAEDGHFYQYSGISTKGWITIYPNITDFCFSYNFVIQENTPPVGGIYPPINERLTALENGTVILDGILVVDGDSIMEEGNVTDPLSDISGLTINNQARSGSGYVNGPNIGTTNMLSRAPSIAAKNPFLVLLAGGTNDYKFDVPLGSAAVTNDDTQFYSAIFNTFRIIKEGSPTVQVLVATPIQRYYGPDSETRATTNTLGLKLIDYVNVIKEVAEVFSIQVIDLYSMSSITWENRNSYTYDGLHPNTLGGGLMANKIYEYLKFLAK